MRVTLVHNPKAGEGTTSREELLATLKAAGHEVHYLPHDEIEKPGALDDPGEVVIAAGGDGTVANVATRIVGRGPSLAILPTGTANNIARSFEIQRGVRVLVDSLGPDGRAVPWDIGLARAPWGDRRFVEAAGVGLFARALREVEQVPADQPHADPSKAESRHDEIRRGRRHLSQVLERTSSRRLTITADGVDLSGEYLFAEVLNIRFAGPGLMLAPDGAAGDGQLALVTLRSDERAAFGDFLSAAIRGTEASCPAVTRRVRSVQISWPVGDGRLDDQEWPDAEGRAAAELVAKPMVEISTVGEQVSVMLTDAD